jgi:hypothetical protein
MPYRKRHGGQTESIDGHRHAHAADSLGHTAVAQVRAREGLGDRADPEDGVLGDGCVRRDVGDPVSGEELQGSVAHRPTHGGPASIPANPWRAWPPFGSPSDAVIAGSLRASLVSAPEQRPGRASAVAERPMRR